MSDLDKRAHVLRNAAGLYDEGIVAVKKRGELLHPECQTYEETQFAGMFFRVAPVKTCRRCKRRFLK